MITEHAFLKKIDQNPNAFYVINSLESQIIMMHFHNKYQIYYIDGGLTFFNTPSKSFFLPVHHFLWIPSEIEHNITASNSVKTVHNIFFPNSLIVGNEELKKKPGIYPITNLLMEMFYYIKNWSGEVSQGKNRAQYEFLIAIKNVVLEVADVPLPIELPTTNNESLSKVLHFIQSQLDQPLQLDQVASEFGYSSRTLSRLFQNNINTSFLQYVKLSRVIRAMELLLQTSLSVSDITYKCGYGNLSSFSYVFQQIMHCSPVEFRKKNGI